VLAISFLLFLLLLNAGCSPTYILVPVENPVTGCFGLIIVLLLFGAVLIDNFQLLPLLKWIFHYGGFVIFGICMLIFLITIFIGPNKDDDSSSSW